LTSYANSLYQQFYLYNTDVFIQYQYWAFAHVVSNIYLFMWLNGLKQT